MLAEKLVTAIERGTGNTRWRDFADIYLLSNAHTVRAATLARAIRAVAGHRGVAPRPLAEALDGYAALASQARPGL